jgi:PEP-CTERM motif
LIESLRRLLCATVFFGAGSACALVVNEATYAGAGGDYNNLLNPPLAAAVIFSLDDGTNTFAGTFGTPGDHGDTVLISLGATQTLRSISISFATNADDFNPVAINQNSKLVFDSTSSSSATPLVELNLTGRPDGPITFASGLLAIGQGLYNTTLLTEVLALNNNAKVGYVMSFDVTAVPEPASVALMVAGLGVLGLCVRRRSTQTRPEVAARAA